MDRAEQYVRDCDIALAAQLGSGKDGCVWRTTRPSALKVHELATSYQFERDAYIRLRNLQIRKLIGFTVPLMLEHDDELLAIEMEIVFPPFIVDFASARLDEPPNLIEDEGHTLADLVRERFDENADRVLALHDELIARAGIYLMDLHPHNIKFATG